MGKRGPKPKKLVDIRWSENFAYAIGLLASDGNLSPDGRHIVFVTKDKEQAECFKKALKLKCKVGKRSSGVTGEKKYHVVQFSDVHFYQFLIGIGITPAKSKTLGKVAVPGRFFLDFLRGSFDGDGHSYSYWDVRWRSSFMFYMGFSSASISHILWIQKELKKLLGVIGHIDRGVKRRCFQLRYSKGEARIVASALYQTRQCLHLKRKRLKIKESLAIIGWPLERKIEWRLKNNAQVS